MVLIGKRHEAMKFSMIKHIVRDVPSGLSVEMFTISFSVIAMNP